MKDNSNRLGQATPSAGWKRWRTAQLSILMLAVLSTLLLQNCSVEVEESDPAEDLALLLVLNAARGNLTTCASTSIGTAAAIQLGVTQGITASVATNGNCFYRFDNASGASYNFVLTPTQGGDVDLYLSNDGATPTAPTTFASYPSNGWTNQAASSSGTDSLSRTVAQFRYIQVNGFSSSQGGGFTLSVQ